MSPIKIFGHKAPDTDATCAPIIWAEYLKSKGTEATPYVLGMPNTEALFVLKRWGFETPELLGALTENDEVIIADTNNPGELPDDIDQAEILQVIDHHKVFGGLVTPGPIDMTIRPLSSTATVMTTLMTEPLGDLPENILGLILSCIISDTLEFRSPTTTEFDKNLAEEIASLLNVNITEYATQMFAAKSEISHFSAKELLRLDSKIVELNGTRLRVAVLETTTPETILDRKAEIMAAMEALKAEEKVEHVLLFVIDILNESATLFVPNGTVKDIAEKAFNVAISGDTIVLPDIVSRKKQIIPALSE